jgi:hypothetical protein
MDPWDTGGKVMRKLAISWALAFAAPLATAQVWVSMGYNAEGELLVDVSSIRPQGTMMKAWSLWKGKYQKVTPGAYPEKYYFSYKSLEYFDCKNGSAAQKQIAFYSDDAGVGDIVGGYNFTDGQLNFQDPIPGSFGSFRLARVCQYHR